MAISSYLPHMAFGRTLPTKKSLISKIIHSECLLSVELSIKPVFDFKGSAEVIFVRRSDAFKALKRYNNVQLDGKPMKVEIIGADAGIPVSARVNFFGGANGKRTVVMGSGTSLFRGGSRVDKNNRGPIHRGRGGSNVGRGGGRGGGRGRGCGRGVARGRKIVEKSADELDKDLGHYHAETMQS